LGAGLTSTSAGLRVMMQMGKDLVGEEDLVL
jgi:hypothetical protein